MASAPHILVFDSGAGGLSIARAILASTSGHIRMSYVADHDVFPYGDKSSDFLLTHIQSFLGDFITQRNPDLVVIACNTASTIVLPKLRERFSCPFVGVVPAIKPAANLSRTKAIGVLATPETVKRDYTNGLVKEFAPNCQVFMYGSDILVRIAEDSLMGVKPDLAILANELGELFKQQNHTNIDTVVLGCTHFPLIRQALSLASPQPVQWVDSSEAVAQRVKYLLNDMGLKIASTAGPEVEIFLSDTKLEVKRKEIQAAYEHYLMNTA